MFKSLTKIYFGFNIISLKLRLKKTIVYKLS